MVNTKNKVIITTQDIRFVNQVNDFSPEAFDAMIFAVNERLQRENSAQLTKTITNVSEPLSNEMIELLKIRDKILDKDENKVSEGARETALDHVDEQLKELWYDDNILPPPPSEVPDPIV